MNYKVILETRWWERSTHIVTWGSIVFYAAFLLLYGMAAYIVAPDYFYVPYPTLARPNTWLLLILAPFACIIYDIVVKWLNFVYWPRPSDIMREIEIMEKRGEAPPAMAPEPPSAPTEPGLEPTHKRAVTTIQPQRVFRRMSEVAIAATHSMQDHTGFDFSYAEKRGYFAQQVDEMESLSVVGRAHVSRFVSNLKRASKKSKIRKAASAYG
jgi:hypothetical protein